MCLNSNPLFVAVETPVLICAACVAVSAGAVADLFEAISGQNHCAALARAPYADTVAAVLSGDPTRVAQLFHKYDGSSPNPWNQPATAWAQGSATPDLSGVAGKYAPLWTDDVVNEPDVLYDAAFDVYLAVYPFQGARLRASKDLIHWSPHFSASFSPSGSTLTYLTLQGET
jgi:hypothetical protein